MENSLYFDLLKELECPICTNYMGPPIIQCAAGHNICNSCRCNLQQCALCQGRFTESRNISLETLAQKTKYPCINFVAGCKETLSYVERAIHESSCTFKKYKCGLKDCSWIGNKEEVTRHWLSKNLPLKPYKAKNNCVLSLKTPALFTNLTQAFGKLFWFRYNIIGKLVFFSLQYVLNDEEDEYFVYDIEISKPKRPEKKIILTDYCQSNKFDDKDLFKTENCIVGNVDVLKEFTENDRLIFIMKIRQIIIPSKKLAALAVAQNTAAQSQTGQGAKKAVPPQPQQQKHTKAQKKKAKAAQAATPPAKLI